MSNPIAKTIHQLLTATRAHAGFVMRPGGEQALANVLHVAELARQYEARGAVSFRGFVEELLRAGETGAQAEAAIFEEGSEGVRLMNTFQAKGLEFPIVVLADSTFKIARDDPERYLDAERGLCAVKLAGWTPQDVIDHGAEEHARDLAEGIRIAYDFVREASLELKRVKTSDELTRYPGQDLIRYSMLPWFDFTSISHARDLSKKDSAPRITFGKITDANGRCTMPISVHVHHGLIDGEHVARFVELFGQKLAIPESD